MKDFSRKKSVATITAIRKINIHKSAHKIFTDKYHADREKKEMEEKKDEWNCSCDIQ